MKNLTLTFLVFLSLILSQKLLAQNVAVNSTGSNPDTSAMLDVSSTSTGFLMPRMTTSQQNAIILPATGLTIFNTSLNSIMLNIGTPLSPNWSSLGTTATGGWTLTGNSGINPVINFLGTTDNKSLRFRTNNTQRMKIDSATGNVAIGQDVFDATNPEKVVINAGTTTSVNALVAKGSIDSYLQLNIQNQSAGAAASSDIVATANNGTKTTNFIDMGINGSGNTSNILGVRNDAYLYNEGQNFFIANSTPAKSLIFLTGGTDSATNERMRISGTGDVGIKTIPVSTLDVSGSTGYAITTTTANITLGATNHTVILTGGTPGVTLPTAASSTRRIYEIVNESGGVRGISNYKALSGATTNIIKQATSITIQSDGTTWYQIR